METLRQQMIEMLKRGTVNAASISRELGIMEKDVYGHLVHISRSLQAQGKKLVIYPAQCLKCGFIFRDRKRFTPPGRCPHCKGTHIQRPAYEVKAA